MKTTFLLDGSSAPSYLLGHLREFATTLVVFRVLECSLTSFAFCKLTTRWWAPIGVSGVGFG